MVTDSTFAPPVTSLDGPESPAVEIAPTGPTGAPEAAALFDHITTADGMYVVDQDQRIVSWNESARQILGFAEEDVVGKQCFELLAASGPRNGRFCRQDCPVIVNSRRSRVTPDYDLHVQSPFGEDIWINVSIMLSRPPGSASNLVAHLFRDVTGQRELERLTARAVDALGHIAARNDPLADDSARMPSTPVPALTPRESQVLRLLACGVSTRSMAETMAVSPLTVRNHISNLTGKLGARSRLQAVAIASRLRII